MRCYGSVRGAIYRAEQVYQEKDTRTCSKCGKTKPLAHFMKNGRVLKMCDRCRAYAKKYRKEQDRKCQQ